MDASTDATRRYCWECQRRRLECDSTRPVCNKCRHAGVVCPGYEDKKPLRWLAPGRVTSRNRKRKTNTTVKAKKPENSDVVLQSKITVALKRAVQVATDLYAAPMIPVIHFRDDVSEAVQSACYCKSNLILTLGHYLHQTRPPKSERVELWCRFHAEKGLSLRGISEEVALDKDLRGLDLAVYSIMCLMLIDLSYGCPENWRVHFLAAMKAVAYRGGIKQLHERNVAMQPTLKYFMIQINRLRLQTTQPPELHDPDSPSAQDLLSKILGFNPDEWASLYPDSYRELFLLARIYHAAVALYCISALRNLFPTGFLYNLLMLRAAQADCLFGLLREAIQSPKTQPCLMWILNVAGVEAATRSLSDRLFVEEALDELSRGLGTGYPLVAREAIHRLWDSGKTEWDDCYDRPYAFLS
ncbi:C6 zinc finger domain protein [Apiospora sp. TS-2023a]